MKVGGFMVIIKKNYRDSYTVDRAELEWKEEDQLLLL
jgi:hypothetical protein